MNGHTFPIEAGADNASLHGPAILLIVGRKFAKAVEDDEDMKQVSYDALALCLSSWEWDQQRSWCRKIELLARFQRMWCH